MSRMLYITYHTTGAWYPPKVNKSLLYYTRKTLNVNINNVQFQDHSYEYSTFIQSMHIHNINMICIWSRKVHEMKMCNNVLSLPSFIQSHKSNTVLDRIYIFAENQVIDMNYLTTSCSYLLLKNIVLSYKSLDVTDNNIYSIINVLYM